MRVSSQHRNPMCNLTLSRVALAAVLSCLGTGVGKAQEWPTREGHVVTDDGVRLHWRAYGERGDTIVFLHGGPGGRLNSQLDNLSELARTHVLIGYTQRGAEGSRADSATLTVERHVADIEQVRRHFGIDQMTLLGHSWGGALATLYAAQYPQHVERLILNGPMPPARTPFNGQRDAAVGAAIRRICSDQLGAAADSAAIDGCMGQRGMNLRVYYADTMNIARSRAAGGIDQVTNRAGIRSLGEWDFRPVMARVRAPTLVVEGALTPVPLDQVRLWAALIPDARVLLLERVGHAYGSVESPSAFFGAIRMFLNGEWPDGSTEVVN